MTEKQLSQCIEGVTGIVSMVNGYSPTTARLLEMGLIPGEEVRVLRGGNPLILQVGDTRLCVRPRDLEGIRLIPIEERDNQSAEMSTALSWEMSESQASIR